MNPYRDPFFVPRDSGLPDAKHWLAKNGKHVHPAFSSSSQYDGQRAQPPPQKQQHIDAFQSHSDRFSKALEVCQKCSKNDLKDLDISKSISWDDVMWEYGNAYRKYESKAKGFMGLSRKLGRAAGDNAPSIMPFLNFLPEGQYKTLFAGLFLIFGAAGRMSNRRQQILRTFEGIPTMIYDADKCCEFCPTDESLQHEVMELYIAILIAIMDMMEWLVETGGFKQIKALYQGPRYGRSIDAKIGDVEKQSASVQRCIERVKREMMARTESNTEQTVHLATHMKENTEQTVHLATGIRANTKEIQADTRAIQADTTKIKEDSAASRTGISRVEEKQAEFGKMIREMQSLLQDNKRNNEWYEKREIELQKRELALARIEDQLQFLTVGLEEAQDHRKSGMILESDQLLDVLAVNLTEVANNLTSMLRAGQAANLSYHDRGSLLSRSPKFQTWLTSTSPIFLLVDGNGHSAAERTSAMTFVSALLGQSLNDEGVSCIHYFCGLHRTTTDDLYGPSGLLRSLLAQLINLYAFRVGFTNYSAYHELQRFDTIRLCALFSELVKDLPEGYVLICIIDGVSLYETSEWAEDLRRILETLNSLTRDLNVYAVFKVLATSAMASRQAIRYTPREDHLMLPVDAGKGTNSPLTARHLKMQARRSMASRTRSPSPESPQSFLPGGMDEDEGFVDGASDDEL